MTARSAAADTLTLMWDPSPDSNVAGYLVYVGTQSGSYSTTYDVGNTTSFGYPSASPGQTYYFAVAAYFQGPVVGTRSTEVSGTSNASPVLLDPGTQSSVVGNSVSLQLVGSDPAGEPVSYGVTTLPPGLSITPATGRISGTPSTAGSYIVTAVVTDGVLSDSETFTWNVSAPAAIPPAGGSGGGSDSTAPVLTITMPTTRGSYSTNEPSVTFGGTAIDNVSVTEVTWRSDRGPTGRATGTDTWIAGVPLQRGSNAITVSARDAAGNVTTKSVVVKVTGKWKF